jgi:hypothetical protein
MNGTSDNQNRKHKSQSDTSQENQAIKSSEEAQRTEARLKSNTETTAGKSSIRWTKFQLEV